MLNAEVTKETTKVIIRGDLTDICSDLANIISAINERLTERDSKLGYTFRLMFTKGFMDGICFKDDAEHMKHYLEEANKREEKHKEVREMMDDFLDFLKGKLDELEKFNKSMGEDEEREDNDEAE